ncbi:MAG: hypothetical protein KF893_02035 [Caldilineaceae bacterium]|nr:hypothetical protein [Caldilineaceae bacterium]
MFQNSALPTTADLPRTLPHVGSLRTLKRLLRVIPLPHTAKAYLLWTLIMAVVAGLVSLQIWISLRITQAEQALVVLQREYTGIEQENAELLWQISQFTQLDRIQIEAQRMGYAPALKREYRWVQPSPMKVSENPETSLSLSQSAMLRETSATVQINPWYVHYWQQFQSWWKPRGESIGMIRR